MGKTYHAVIESENLDSWTWFLSHLKIAIPESVGMTLISDRDKGLLGAEEAVYGNSIQRLICCFHLKGNVCKWYSNTVASYFWAIANAYSREQYTIAMAALEQYNEGAAIYLKAIDSKLWVTAFYIGPYYGHKTSNVVESTNKVLFKEQRELPILDLLDAIWQYVMNKRCKHALQLPPQIHTEYAYQQLLCNQRWADANTVQLSSQFCGTITQRNHKTFITNLQYRICTCGHFQANGIPCGHAFTQTLLPAHPSPRDYVPYYFTTLAWERTYKVPLASISLGDIKAKPNPGCT